MYVLRGMFSEFVDMYKKQHKNLNISTNLTISPTQEREAIHIQTRNDKLAS